MIKSERIITELYSSISNGDYSLLRIQKALSSFKYQVGVFTLDELEKKFRGLFNLSAYNGQPQDQLLNFVDIHGENKPIYISKEFYQKVQHEVFLGEMILSKGYIVFIKKNKMHNEENNRQWFDQNLQHELENMKLFLARLEKSLRLTKHGDIYFDQVFAFIPDENRIIKSRPIPHPETFSKSHIKFEERDNYALKIFLNIENRVSYSVDLAMKNFVESFHIQNQKLRYINMLLCLDLCFNTSSGESYEIICGYVSRLLAKNDLEYKMLLNEMRAFYQLKNRIITGNILNELIAEPEADIVNRKMARLEEIVRKVIKKMVRFNHKERSKFKEELKSHRGLRD